MVGRAHIEGVLCSSCGKLKKVPVRWSAGQCLFSTLGLLELAAIAGHSKDTCSAQVAVWSVEEDTMGHSPGQQGSACSVGLLVGVGSGCRTHEDMCSA